jgi:hypothetical protein
MSLVGLPATRGMVFLWKINVCATVVYDIWNPILLGYVVYCSASVQ